MVDETFAADKPASSRTKPPARLYTETIKVEIGGTKLFLSVSTYPSDHPTHPNQPCALFVDMPHKDATLRSVLDGWAILMSYSLQWGVPLEKLVEKFLFTKFEPAGVVRGHDRIRMCTSLYDFVARELAIRYLGRDDLAHTAP